MALTAAETAEQLDRVERATLDAVSASLRILLRSTATAARAALRSGGQPVLTAAASMGEAASEWAALVDREVIPVLASEMRAAYAAAGHPVTTTVEQQITAYMSRVRDRLVLGGNPPVYAESFDLIRQTIARAGVEGWSRTRLADRIAAELSWDATPAYWAEELARTNAAIDAILDPLGSPGSSAREAARMGDPRVRALQEERARLVRLRDAERSHWQARATRIARTESTGAMSDVQLRALASEGATHKVWNSAHDLRTRDTHVAADGQTVRLTQPFQVGDALLEAPGDPNGPAEEVINCVVGSTQVEWPGQDQRLVTRRDYSGILVEIVTARGHHLTVTPNHPVLTPAGYLPAQSLRVGQQVVGTDGPPAPEVEDGPPRIEEVHRAAGEVGTTLRIHGRRVDFHGDGSNTEVQIVRADSDLLFQSDTPALRHRQQPEFVGLLDRSGGLPAAGVAIDTAVSLDGGSGSAGSPAAGGVAGAGQGTALLGGEALHAEPVGLGPAAYPEPEFPQPTGDDGSGDAEFTRHLKHALALGMTPCEVVKINLLAGNHPVYNLHTSAEWYIGNGIAQHNCRCFLTAPLPEPGDDDDLLF